MIAGMSMRYIWNSTGTEFFLVASGCIKYEMTKECCIKHCKEVLTSFSPSLRLSFGSQASKWGNSADQCHIEYAWCMEKIRMSQSRLKQILSPIHVGVYTRHHNSGTFICNDLVSPLINYITFCQAQVARFVSVLPVERMISRKVCGPRSIKHVATICTLAFSAQQSIVSNSCKML